MVLQTPMNPQDFAREANYQEGEGVRGYKKGSLEEALNQLEEFTLRTIEEHRKNLDALRRFRLVLQNRPELSELLELTKRLKNMGLNL